MQTFGDDTKCILDAINNIVASIPKVDNTLHAKVDVINTQVQALKNKVDSFRNHLKGDWTSLCRKINLMIEAKPAIYCLLPIDDDKKEEKGKGKTKKNKGKGKGK